MVDFEVELTFPITKKYTVKALGEVEAEDEAVELWKKEYPDSNIAALVIDSVTELDGKNA